MLMLMHTGKKQDDGNLNGKFKKGTIEIDGGKHGKQRWEFIDGVFFLQPKMMVS